MFVLILFLLLACLCATAVQAAEPLPLAEALATGRVTAVAHAEDTDRLLVRITNPQAAALAVSIQGILVAVPTQANLKPTALIDELGREKLEALQKQVDQPITWQHLIVGAVIDRGGLAGRQVVELAGGQFQELELPIVRTRLERFRPAREFGYRLITVESWTDDARLRALLAAMASQGASQGAAQAATWQRMTGLSLQQLRLVKRRDCSDDELKLAEHLIEAADAVARHDRETLAPIPAKVYLNLVNRSGEAGLAMVRRMSDMARNGGLFGLPVVLEEVDRAALQTPAEIGLAVGCQISITRTADEFQSRVLFRFWDGRTFEAQREFLVWLGKQVSPEAALDMIETGVLRHLVKLETVKLSTMQLGEPQEAIAIEITNHFPLALHQLELRVKADAPGGARNLILSGYAIGPQRSLRVEVGTTAANLEVMGAAWGP